MEAGPVVSNGMGLSAISWRELQAWEHGTGIELQPWESRLIRMLSAEYVSTSRKATEPDCPPPWVGEEDLPRWKALQTARNVREQMRSRAQG